MTNNTEPSPDTLRAVYAETKEDIRVEEGRLQNVSYTLTAGYFAIAGVILLNNIDVGTAFQQAVFSVLMILLYLTVGGYIGSLRRHTLDNRKEIGGFFNAAFGNLHKTMAQAAQKIEAEDEEFKAYFKKPGVSLLHPNRRRGLFYMNWVIPFVGLATVLYAVWL